MNSGTKQLVPLHNNNTIIILCFSLAIIATVAVAITSPLSLSCSPGFERSRMLYVTPSSSIQCHMEPCLTLNQFAKTDSSSWMSPNTWHCTILIFVAGNHILIIDFLISDNIINFPCLVPVPPLKVLMSLSTATHKHILSLIIQNEVWINGLKFIGCGSNKFSSIKRFTIENSTFQGQPENDSGTAIDITGTNLTLMNR